jgi:cyanophycin synthetase
MPNKCPACGNNPTPHALAWFSESLTVSLNSLNQVVGKSFLNRLFSRAFESFTYGLIVVFQKLGVLKINTDPNQVAGLRGKVLWEEAARRGIPMHSLVFAGKNTDTYGVTIQEKKFYFSGIPRLSHTSSGSEWWMDDKAVLKNKLQEAGIPVPRGGVFSRYEPLKKMFATLDKPVIIKPRLGSRGRHTTTTIFEEKDLKTAFVSAKQLCYWVILEEHLIGSVYRGTCIDGVLVGVLRGDPPRITGDGVHTIDELVGIKNANRHPDVRDVVLGSEHEAFLARRGFTFSSVLPPGKTIDLLEKIGISYGGYSAEVTDEMHPKTKEYLEAAAGVVGDPILGFDFIIDDIAASPDTQKWGIIECNGVPFINLHHFPIEGKPNNVAQHVWNFVEKNIDTF